MKKILLATVLLIGVVFAGNAQKIAFQYEGKNLENGASFVYDGFSSESYGIPGYMEYKIDPELHIVSDDDVQISVNVKSDIGVQFCAFDNQCMMGTDITKEGFLLKKDKPENLLLDYVTDGDGSDIDLPLINMTITAWDVANPSNIITLKVKMGGFNTPVEQIVSPVENISVAGKTLNYTFEGVSAISVYSLSGKTVISRNVVGSGSISLANLPAGVYIYRVEGKKEKSGKFILR